MTDKEWLEDIKERLAKYQTDYNLNGDDVEWLIQQAERVEELEEDIKKIIKTADVIDEKNQRFAQALETVKINTGDPDKYDPTVIVFLNEVAINALKGESDEGEKKT